MDVPNSALRSAWPLWFCLGLYVAIRVGVLAVDFDAHCNPGYEQTMSGSIAHDLSSGAPLSRVAMYYDNCGGHLVSGALAAILFALLGESYLVLKLVPLGFGLATLVLLWKLLEPRVGRLGASLAGLLFATTPPNLVRLSMHAMGNHFEALFFLVLLTLLWARWIEGKPRPWRAPLFGLVAGFATFFYFGSLLWLAVLFCAHMILTGTRRSLRDLLASMPTFLVGLLPLVWAGWRTDGRPLAFLGFNLGATAPPTFASAWARATELVGSILPRSGLYQDLGPLSAGVAEALALLVFLAAWGLGAVRLMRTLRTRGSEDGRATWVFLPLFLYFPALVVGFALSRFRFVSVAGGFDVISLRYLAQHQFVVLALTSVVVAWSLRGSKLERGLGSALGVAALVLGANVLTLGVSGSNRATDGLRYRGWSSRYATRVLASNSQERDAEGRTTWDTAWLEARLADYTELEREEMHMAAGYYRSWQRLMDPSVLPADLLPGMSAASRAGIARGVGSYLRERNRAPDSSTEALRSRLDFILANDPEHAPHVVEGLAMDFDFPLQSDALDTQELDGRLVAAIPAAYAEHWARGLGRARKHAMRVGAMDQLQALHSVQGSLAAEHPRAFGEGLGLPANRPLDSVANGPRRSR